MGLVNCQQDDFTDKTPTQEAIKAGRGNSKHRIIQKADIQKNKKLVQSLDKLKSINSKRSLHQTNKTVIDTITGIEIESDYAKYLERIDGSYHSYTFYVTNTPPDSGFENVFISLQSDGTYKEFLVHYNLTAEDIYAMNNDTYIVNLDDKVTITELNGTTFSGSVFGKAYFEDGCWKESTYVPNTCASGNHVFGDPTCSYITNGQTENVAQPGGEYVTTILYCPNNGGGDNEDPGDPMNPPPNPDDNPGQGGDGAPPKDESVPVPCNPRDPLCIEEDDDPCHILNGVTNNSRIEPAISNLKAKTNGSQEYAYEIEYRYDTPSEAYQHIPILRTSGENFSADVDTGGFIQGQAHNHPKNGLAIPSWGDIRWTSKHEEANIPLNDGNAYNIVVVKDPENTDSTLTYAITISNLNALQTQINHEMTRPKILRTNDTIEKIKKINKKFGEYFVDIQDDTDALEEKFLEVYADYGISLFKMNEETDNWEELKLVDNEVIKEPCDN